MAGGVDLKLLHDVRDFLSSENDQTSSKAAAKPGSFSLFSFPMQPKHPWDEVYPGIIIGEASVARKTDELSKMGVTHVVNVCMGKKFNQVDTDQDYYKEVNISFHGIPALDIMTFQLQPYFRPAGEFIENALAEGGRVYVHCQQGVSRSASIVLAFLMLHRQMGLMDAVRLVRAGREVFPNEGFLKQLCHLDRELRGTRHTDS